METHKYIFDFGWGSTDKMCVCYRRRRRRAANDDLVWIRLSFSIILVHTMCWVFLFEFRDMELTTTSSFNLLGGKKNVSSKDVKIGS